MSLEQNIKKWVEYDSLLKAYNEKIKELRMDKNNIEKQIHSSISSYSKKPVIQISDGVLKFNKATVQQPLSYKLIENSLNQSIQNEDEVKRIMNIIRQNRTSKECDIIKRYYR